MLISMQWFNVRANWKYISTCNTTKSYLYFGRFTGDGCCVHILFVFCFCFVFVLFYYFFGLISLIKINLLRLQTCLHLILNFTYFQNQQKAIFSPNVSCDLFTRYWKKIIWRQITQMVHVWYRNKNKHTNQHGIQEMYYFIVNFNTKAILK